MSQISDHISQRLNNEDKDYLNQIEGKLQDDENALHTTCSFVVEKVGQKDVSDFDKLKKEQKLQACMDHLAISLISGDIEKEEINDILENK